MDPGGPLGPMGGAVRAERDLVPRGRAHRGIGGEDGATLDEKSLREVRRDHRAGTDVLPGSSPRDRRPGARAEQEHGFEPILLEAPRILVVLGPTGTGKTRTAVEVAERLDGEVVGCDALQVYRGFEVATAKPEPDLRERVAHHLVDVADPRRDFSVADYVRLADRAIAEIAARGRVPLVAGGTGMYLRGLLRGLVGAPPRDAHLRERIRRLALRFGAKRLHRWLSRLDRESAERLHPGDTQRIVRALEIALAGGLPWSEALRRHGTWSGSAERYRAVKFGLDADRDVLARRLDARVEDYFRSGLVEEVRSLLEQGVPPRANAFKAIGYREVLAAVLAGESPEATLDAVRVNTRRFAKRQRTWFRKEPHVTWLDADAGPVALAERIVRTWGEPAL